MATLSSVNSSLQGEVQQLKNWSGNVEFSTDRIFYPNSVEEVQRLVKELDTVKAVGTRHCFNRIADSKDNLISFTEMNKVVSFDATAQTVTVEAGIKYGVLAPYLDGKGYALHNLASLPHISVGGSIATATHGSGVANGNLATSVTALEMVAADGSLVHISKDKDGDQFAAAVVGLGALGLVTNITLAVERSFMVQQNVFVGLPLAELKDNFDKIVAAGYSVSLFTDWQTDQINETWIKRRSCDETDLPFDQNFFGAAAATKNLHPIAGISAENCTDQMGVPGKWYERLPHFKMGYTPSSGVELQSEYFVSQHHAVEAILAIQQLGKQLGPYLFISEIRTIAADKLWMSPCYRQPSVAIHFTWKQDWEAISKLLPLIEQELEPYDAKPHWGKLFTMSPKLLTKRYEKLEDFKKMVDLYDPKGKFKNEFLNGNIFNS
jgi:xylitol oxidase